MSLIAFHHADRDIIFSISSRKWDDLEPSQKTSFQQITTDLGPGDVGKVLIVNADGEPAWVTPPLNNVQLRHIKIPGNSRYIADNLNALTSPLIIQNNEIWIITNIPTNQVYVWARGKGIFGSNAGGINILMEDLIYLTTNQEEGQENAQAGVQDNKKVSLTIDPSIIINDKELTIRVDQGT